MKNVLLNENPVFEWQNQSKQYPAHGTGIMYYKGILPSGKHVHCLLYYGENNTLEGVLNYYPVDIPPLEKKGSINLEVRFDRRRQGIATALLNEAIQRWEINLKKQAYTTSGERFINFFMRTSVIYKEYRNRIQR
jgi:GNAT superfamily N-acetyltransferase